MLSAKPGTWSTLCVPVARSPSWARATTRRRAWPTANCIISRCLACCATPATRSFPAKPSSLSTRPGASTTSDASSAIAESVQSKWLLLLFFVSPPMPSRTPRGAYCPCTHRHVKGRTDVPVPCARAPLWGLKPKP